MHFIHFETITGHTIINMAEMTSITLTDPVGSEWGIVNCTHKSGIVEQHKLNAEQYGKLRKALTKDEDQTSA